MTLASRIDHESVVFGPAQASHDQGVVIGCLSHQLHHINLQVATQISIDATFVFEQSSPTVLMLNWKDDFRAVAFPHRGLCRELLGYLGRYPTHASPPARHSISAFRSPTFSVTPWSTSMPTPADTTCSLVRPPAIQTTWSLTLVSWIDRIGELLSTACARTLGMNSWRRIRKASTA